MTAAIRAVFALLFLRRTLLQPPWCSLG